MAYMKPIRPMFVVSSEKAKEFATQKADAAVKEERKKLVALFRKNNQSK